MGHFLRILGQKIRNRQQSVVPLWKQISAASLPQLASGRNDLDQKKADSKGPHCLLVYSRYIFYISQHVNGPPHLT